MYRSIPVIVGSIVTGVVAGLISHLIVFGKNFPVGNLQFTAMSTSLIGNHGLAEFEISNPQDFPVQVLGISRTDCGPKLVSDEAPFRLDARSSRKVSCNLNFANADGTFEIPIVVFVDSWPHKLPLTLEFASDLSTVQGTPTLAPPLQNEGE